MRIRPTKVTSIWHINRFATDEYLYSQYPIDDSIERPDGWPSPRRDQSKQLITPQELAERLAYEQKHDPTAGLYFTQEKSPWNDAIIANFGLDGPLTNADFAEEIHPAYTPTCCKRSSITMDSERTP